MADLNISVVTPEATTLEQAASFVVVPLYDGELGIAPGHSPMIGRLGYGELRVTAGEATERYYVDGGFVQVADNKVTVLTNRALEADALDASTAASDLETARARPSSTPELLEIREREVARADSFGLRLAHDVSDNGLGFIVLRWQLPDLRSGSVAPCGKQALFMAVGVELY